jgi:hypothetical protein
MDVDNVRTRYSQQGKNQLIAYYIERCEALESKIQFLEAQLDVALLESNKYNEI